MSLCVVGMVIHRTRKRIREWGDTSVLMAHDSHKEENKGMGTHTCSNGT